MGIVICGVPAVAPLGTEPRIAMKSSLGSSGVSLFIMALMAAHWAARRIGIAVLYAMSFAPPGVMSAASAFMWALLPNLSASCALARLSATSSARLLIGASGPRFW